MTAAPLPETIRQQSIEQRSEPRPSLLSEGMVVVAGFYGGKLPVFRHIETKLQSAEPFDKGALLAIIGSANFMHETSTYDQSPARKYFAVVQITRDLKKFGSEVFWFPAVDDEAPGTSRRFGLASLKLSDTSLEEIRGHLGLALEAV